MSISGQERTHTKISKDSGDSKGKCASACVDPNALSDGIMTIDDGCTKVVSLITKVSCEEGVKATSTVYSGCLKGKAALESLSVLAVVCSGESSGTEALSVEDIHGEDVQVKAVVTGDGDAASSQNACHNLEEISKDLEECVVHVKKTVVSGEVPALDGPGAAYCVQGLNHDAVVDSLVVVGSSAEKEAKVSLCVIAELECLSIAASGGLKALDKSGATENSSDKVNCSATGGGTAHIPSKVKGSEAGILSSEEDQAEIAKGHTECVEQNGAESAPLIDTAANLAPLKLDEDTVLEAAVVDVTLVDKTGSDTGLDLQKSPYDKTADLKIAARNGLTGAPEALVPVVGIEVAVQGSADVIVVGVPITAGGGDLVLVACNSGPLEDGPLYTLIGGGVLSEPSEGKESLGSKASDRPSNVQLEASFH